jgi:hypothetical protein
MIHTDIHYSELSMDRQACAIHTAAACSGHTSVWNAIRIALLFQNINTAHSAVAATQDAADSRIKY